MIRDIAGRQNHSVKLARKLQQKKHRRDRGLLVCEGMDLLAAAVASNAAIKDVLVRRDLAEELPSSVLAAARESGDQGEGPDIGVCAEETLAYASSLGGSADVVFTCLQPQAGLGDLGMGSGTTFFLDSVGDPGNVGTLIRTALAFGLRGVVCSPGTADPFGPKAMRAGMGSQFLLPIVTEVPAGDLAEKLTVSEAKGQSAVEILVADPHEGEDVAQAEWPSGCVFVLGSERDGPGDEWQAARRVRIPQSRVESLNVAMAGTIIAYEAWRKGRAGTSSN